MSAALIIVCAVLFVLLLILLTIGGGVFIKVNKVAKELVRRLDESYESSPNEACAQAVITDSLCGKLKCLPEDTVQTLTLVLNLCEALLHCAQESKNLLPPDWIIAQTNDLPYFAAVGLIDDDRQILVVFRGTASLKELDTDDLAEGYLRTHGLSQNMKLLSKLGIPLPFPPQTNLNVTGPERVNAGFMAVYAALEPSLTSAISLKKMEAATRGKSVLGISVGGHSLGAGVASVFASKLAASVLTVSLFVAACPKPGNAAFANYLISTGVACTSLINDADVIPQSPSSVVPDLTKSSGLLQYVAIPGSCRFTCLGSTLLACHTIAAYRKGLEAYRGQQKCGIDNSKSHGSTAFTY